MIREWNTKSQRKVAVEEAMGASRIYQNANCVGPNFAHYLHGLGALCTRDCIERIGRASEVQRGRNLTIILVDDIEPEQLLALMSWIIWFIAIET